MSERPLCAIVTGGASGVGLAITEALLERQWNVLITDMNTDAAGRVLAERPEASTGRLRFHQVDVSDETHVETSVAIAVEAFGGIDLYVNNAGIAGAFGPITDIDVADWDFTFAVLVRGVFLGIKHAARAMRTGGAGGSIINIASIAAFDGGTGPQAYSAAKAAVVSLTQSSSVELARFGIRVNAIAPGHVMTPLFMKGRDETIIDQVLADQPWQRPTYPADVAHAVLLLADPASASIVGTCLVVDGGLTAAGTQQSRALGIDPRTLDVAGVNRGTTGVRSEVRQRINPPTDGGSL